MYTEVKEKEDVKVTQIYKAIEALFGSGALMQVEDWLEDNTGDKDG